VIFCGFCETNKKQLISEKNEKAKNHRAGGEGGSSRAHGIPHGTGHNQLHVMKRGLAVDKAVGPL
jgi:hypothetical protein